MTSEQSRKSQELAISRRVLALCQACGCTPLNMQQSCSLLTRKQLVKIRQDTCFALVCEFSGRKLLLGQLVHYHVDASQRGKFDPSSKPGLFAGWRYDAGPHSHKAIYYVLDYGRLKERGPGMQMLSLFQLKSCLLKKGSRHFR